MRAVDSPTLIAMAQDRGRQRTDPRRRLRLAPAPDPVGKLDEVLATLEGLLDERGVPSAPVPRPGKAASGESHGEPDARPPPEPSGDSAGLDESLPVLEDVVIPAVGAPPEEGGSPAARELPGAADPEPTPAPERVSPRLGFEIVEEEEEEEEEEESGQGDDLDAADSSPPVAPSPPADSDRERYGGAPPPTLEPEVYRHLVDRLANEIEVIIQTRTDEAMRQAAAEIADRVRKHVGIVFQEIIEELAHMPDRPSD